MAQRKSNWSNQEKIAAWANSAGKHPNHPETVYSEATCPRKHCQIPNQKMEWNKYGNDSHTHWVIDHKVALDNNGSNHISNLQAMHNYCNSVKSNNY